MTTMLSLLSKTNQRYPARCLFIPLTCRFFSSSCSEYYQYLENKLSEKAIPKREQLIALKTVSGNIIVGETSIKKVLGGMRELVCTFCETSQLDSTKGIVYRNKTINQMNELLPKAGEQVATEGVLYLLLTGEVPSESDVEGMRKELYSRYALPQHTNEILAILPKSIHPMNQLIIGLNSLRPQSRFAKAHTNQTHHKLDIWKPALDDVLSMIAQTSRMSGQIYRRCFKGGKDIQPLEDSDFGGNFAHLLGYDSEMAQNMLRLYMHLHADHGGGNVSAHASSLVASALADPYTSFGAGVSGLSGPLHGLANQDCLEFLLDLQKSLNGLEPTEERITEIIQERLESGMVIPGYGHAVLRITDPRYTAQREFALKHFPDAPLFKLQEACYQTIPKLLKATGKVQNPFPNVDAHSGCLLQQIGLTESQFYTVMFAASRCLGIGAQLVWGRILSAPIERPKSLSLDRMENIAAAHIS